MLLLHSNQNKRKERPSLTHSNFNNTFYFYKRQKLHTYLVGEGSNKATNTFVSEPLSRRTMHQTTTCPGPCRHTGDARKDSPLRNKRLEVCVLAAINSDNSVTAFIIIHVFISRFVPNVGFVQFKSLILKAVCALKVLKEMAVLISKSYSSNLLIRL